MTPERKADLFNVVVATFLGFVLGWSATHLAYALSPSLYKNCKCLTIQLLPKSNLGEIYRQVDWAESHKETL